MWIHIQNNRTFVPSKLNFDIQLTNAVEKGGSIQIVVPDDLLVYANINCPFRDVKGAKCEF